MVVDEFRLRGILVEESWSAVEVLGTHPRFADPNAFMSIRNDGHKFEKENPFQTGLLIRVSNSFCQTSSMQAGFLSFYCLYSF